MLEILQPMASHQNQSLDLVEDNRSDPEAIVVPSVNLGFCVLLLRPSSKTMLYGVAAIIIIAVILAVTLSLRPSNTVRCLRSKSK